MIRGNRSKGTEHMYTVVRISNTNLRFLRERGQSESDI